MTFQRRVKVEREEIRTGVSKKWARRYRRIGVDNTIIHKERARDAFWVAAQASLGTE